MLSRWSLAASLAILSLIASPVVQAQQDPTAPATKGNRGGGGGGGFGGPGGGGPGGPGGGGPGGPGGFGGFGGPGGGGPGGRGNNGPSMDSAERLLQIEAVQEDLQVDEKTRAKIKSLGEDAVKERTKRRDTVTKVAQQQAAELAAQQNQLMAEQLAASGIQVDPKTLAAQNNNGGRGGRGGPGGPGGFNQLERQMMTAAMEDLQTKVDAKMLKLISKKQQDRLKQIVLQMEGARAFTQPNQEVVAKLGLTEEQLEQIRNAQNELRQAQWQQRTEVMNSIIPPDSNGGNNNGGGGRGGRGGFPNMQNLDEATRTRLTNAMTDLTNKQSGATMAAIGKLLTKAQQSKYQAMIGAPFDIAKLRPNFGPGGPGGPGGQNGQNANTAANGTAAPAATDAAGSTTATPKAGATRKGSVSSRRGDN